MDGIVLQIRSTLQNNGPLVLLSLAAGTCILIVFLGLLLPQHGKPKNLGKVITGPVKQLNKQMLQAKLDAAQMEVRVDEYIRRSLTFGIPVGLGLALLIGSFVLVGVGILAGFMITWTKLEQERDKKQVKYTKQLASACDIVRTAYGVNPSLKKALEAVAEYGQSPVREDFQEILLAASQERFAEGLQQVAERRKSIVFDTVATSLIRASEASGEVNDMLVRLADSTRQNVSAFEDALTSQLNARSSIQWGTYGPWLIFCIFRVVTLLMSFSASEGSTLFAPMTGYFSTPAGNVLALVASSISILVYRYCTQVSQRGLVVRRVSVTEPTVRMGQKPLNAQTPTGTSGALSAQSRTMAVN
jgi:hypothetical protein